MTSPIANEKPWPVQQVQRHWRIPLGCSGQRQALQVWPMPFLPRHRPAGHPADRQEQRLQPLQDCNDLRSGLRSAANEAHQGSGNARLTIYVPLGLDERIRRSAADAGQSLSMWLQRAAEAALAKEGMASLLSDIKRLTVEERE